MTAVLIAEVKKRLADRQIMLFAGSGVSANIGLPSWGGLIDKMADDIGFDPKLFRTLGEFPALAEYYEIEKHGRDDLVKWMQDEWHKPGLTSMSSNVHDLIVKCDFPRIYTTNYDHWLERSYTERGIKANPIIDVQDLPNLSSDGGKIIKFHGDLDRPETMVLTETDYANRMALESELDIQLRADLFRFGTIFIGYSLSDRNLRYILHKLTQIRNKGGKLTVGERSYLLTHRVNKVEMRLLQQWGIDVIVSDELYPSDALEAFLKDVV